MLPMLTLNCKTCGIEFNTLPCVVRDGNGKYCSKKCCHIALVKKVEIICPQCGEKFLRHPSNMKNGDPCCSQPCGKLRRWARARVERFLSNVVVLPGPNPCWIWTGAKFNEYGIMRVNRKAIFVHRFSYELFRRRIEKGKIILHSCDIPLCVSPSHLSEGSDLDNSRDAAKKGRKARVLSKQDAIEIYISELSPRELAKKYNVTVKNIYCIKWGTIWTQVTEPYTQPISTISNFRPVPHTLRTS